MFLVSDSRWTLLSVPVSSVLVGMPCLFWEAFLLVLIRCLRRSTITLFQLSLDFNNVVSIMNYCLCFNY
ncbi:hypothetical protein POPTR_005G023301v4 [Populus trichocarpa]|uniref:Uncharacterized protein n=1 Tax=Populus trichocarpa TaxID=3694 RepID=A0ACC0SXP7_POPTR|nr:hypothetical protein BDE02_05G016500 [Populus trichocarpa]KAI9393908.1 hypothetical protein POPTR_005G023301v4 [Populus trichocarpa]